MLEPIRARRQFIRRRLAVPRAVAAVLAVTLLAGQVVGGWVLGGAPPRAVAAPSISQIYFTPYEAQEYMGILRAVAGDPACCSGPLRSTISITSGAAGNTVVYDHFEDGYEVDPYNPVQASTLTLSMDDGDVWTQTSSVPVDQPGRGPGNYFDGRDRIVSAAPVAVTQTAYANDPGSLHATAVEVLDLDKSGTAFDIPVGQDADYNSVFEYVGLVVVGNRPATAVQIDADADGSPETTAALGEGETYLVDGGVNLGARIIADKPVAVYVVTGDVGARYEGRDFELYPTAVWTSELVSPVGARSTDAEDGTRVFLFNPGTSPVVVDVTTSAGAAGTINLAARGQGSFLMPRDEGARFAARGGAPIYGLQAITTEGTGDDDETSAYDWGFTLIPVNAATTSVIVPYGPGSAGLTNNYSPVWVTTFADTTLYVDRDGDRSTGSRVDPNGDRYDFSCAVVGLRSYTIYDDGTTNCYRPRDNSAGGGDRDMTGARIYTVDQTRLVSAWGQRSSYVAGSPGLDVGTTILPFPSITMAKASSIIGDADGDGRADPGDTVSYTITMTNLGIIDVGSVLLTDEVPDYSGYVAGSTALDGVPQSDDGAPYSLSPLDADSPAGGLAVGTIPAGATRTAVFHVVVDDPLPFGIGSLLNLATMTTALGNASAANQLPLDAGLEIDKAADPGPVDPGDTINYTIRVFNGAPTEQTGVSLVDILPDGVTFVPGSASGDLSGTPVVVGVPPNLVPSLIMPRGSVLTVTFAVTVDDPLDPATLQLLNTAAVSSDQTPGPISDDAETQVTLPPQPVVTKTPSVASVPEPEGTVTFAVAVQNPGAGDVTLVSLTDDVFGDLLDPLNPAAANNTCPAEATLIAAGGTFSCSFDAYLAGNAGGPDHTDTVTGEVQDGSGRPGIDGDTAVVGFDDVLPALAAAKTASVGSVPEPGGTVTFLVEVENLSVEPVTLASLADSLFGDLLDPL
ncbi:MAG: DUF11 domain-containing protein, partial [Acidimicrobiia bacterium]|nr:DUF11 domain-containing protein [Acidimicrobiia bacterium]